MTNQTGIHIINIITIVISIFLIIIGLIGISNASEKTLIIDYKHLNAMIRSISYFFIGSLGLLIEILIYNFKTKD